MYLLKNDNLVYKNNTFNNELSTTINYSDGTVITYDLGGNILSKYESAYTLGQLPTAATKYTYEYNSNHADYLSKYNGLIVQTQSCGNIEKIGSVTYTWDRPRSFKKVNKSIDK